MSLQRFILDGRYGDLLSAFGIDVEAALQKAHLPLNVFSRKPPMMSEKQYFSFLSAVGAQITNPELPIRIACADQIENFAPPIFASYCSKNGAVCIERLSRHKRLIGPLMLQLQEMEDTLIVMLTTASGETSLPQFLVETEFAFLVGILRKATKERIVPTAVVMREPVCEEAFSDFLGVAVTEGKTDCVVFRKADLLLPFISYDEAMWAYFEPELAKRLAELDVDASVSARVRSALAELLPGGACEIEDVAEKLGLSKRTLQRRLNEENTTFHQQLNSTRELLAIHYIRNTDISSSDIAFLLGYQEINSFLRAFMFWTGKPISEYRKTIE
ncbi:MAG: AraC family transcriptional regulator ligand-binding domain-containing protein [Oscillospiraceae bacterium]|nr:AraC family transcriptional regulator ligand-binding domain-containing protein [Oscillospiraceae bacterium]